MRRVDIARRLALHARAAERRGNHKGAADLFAEALRALIADFPASSCETMSRGENAGDGQIGPRATLQASGRSGEGGSERRDEEGTKAASASELARGMRV